MNYPIAYPVAPMNGLGLHLQTAAFGRSSGDDSVAFAGHSSNAPHRAGRAAVVHHREHLSQRDLEVADSLDRYRYLGARQIEALHFYGHATPLTGARTCRRVLERLTQVGVVRRLDRRIGGMWAGSVSYVYALAPLGYRLLHDDEQSRPRRREPSEEFLDHTLAIAQLAVELHCLARSRGDIDLLEVEPEPHCWRRFTAGLEGTETLKPDLLVALKAGDYDYHWFVEVDLATHSAEAVLRKCQLYQRYWSTGAEQDRSGLFPRVLFVAPSLRRAGMLERTIATARHLNRDLFAVTTTADALDFLTGVTS
jgi:hypothetical protein